MAASLEKKTVTTTFSDNIRSSRPGVFFKIAALKCLRENSKKTFVVKCFLLVKSKRAHNHRCFPGNFRKFFRKTNFQTRLFSLPSLRQLSIQSINRFLGNVLEKLT